MSNKCDVLTVGKRSVVGCRKKDFQAVGGFEIGFESNNKVGHTVEDDEAAFYPGCKFPVTGRRELQQGL